MTMTRIAYREYTAQFATPNGNPVSWIVRDGTNDWNTVNSCLGTNDEYHLAGRAISGAFVDIGGYLGSVGVAVAVDNPSATVLIVEPVPENADLIERNAALNGVNVTVFHGAVGSKGETESEIRFRYVGDPNLEHHAFVGNSSLAYDDGGETPHEKLTVPTLGLASLLDRFGIAEVELMKCDCEGAEWEFFKAPKTTLRRVAEIIGEAHAVRGHHGDDIVALLGATHEVTTSGEGATRAFRAVRR